MVEATQPAAAADNKKKNNKKEVSNFWSTQGISDSHEMYLSNRKLEEVKISPRNINDWSVKIF